MVRFPPQGSGSGGGGSGTDTMIIPAPGGFAALGFVTTPNAILGYNVKSSGLELGSISMAKAGTIKNLYVEVTINSMTGGATNVIAVYKNGAATGLEAVITDGVTGEYSDTSNSFTVVAGDYITFVADSDANPGGTIRIDAAGAEVVF